MSDVLLSLFLYPKMQKNVQNVRKSFKKTYILYEILFLLPNIKLYLMSKHNVNLLSLNIYLKIKVLYLIWIK